MILLVNDANILIDLLKIDLLPSFFRLQYEFHVTDFVVGEVQESNVSDLHLCIENGSLKIKSFDYEELRQIQSLESEYRQLSIADCSCLFHAKTLAARLLTGDAALRKIAEQAEIRVHGILWILDELVADGGLISKTEACEKLRQLMSTNSRLPATECRSRLKRWKKGCCPPPLSEHNF